MLFNRDDLTRKHKEIYFESEFDEIDFNSIKFQSLSKKINVKYDGFNFIKNKIMLDMINRFEAFQPNSYQHLINNTFFYAIDRNPIPVIGDATRFGCIVNNMAYYIDYDPYSYSIKERVGHFYIPKELLDSWFYYCINWSSVEAVLNMEKRNLPSLLLMPVHNLIKGFEDKNTLPQYVDFLEGKFNHLFRQSYQDEKFNNGGKYFELRNLLDTRANDDWSESGFQLFVSSHNNERNVYIVPRANIFKIKKLSNPAEAIDHYAAHIFSRKEGEFDFMQFAEDF